MKHYGQLFAFFVSYACWLTHIVTDALFHYTVLQVNSSGIHLDFYFCISVQGGCVLSMSVLKDETPLCEK